MTNPMRERLSDPGEANDELCIALRNVHRLDEISHVTDIKSLSALARSLLLSSESLAELSNSEHRVLRTEVARNPLTPIDVLATLSQDCEPIVRRAVAKNFSTSGETLQRLRQDSVSKVRVNALLNPGVANAERRESKMIFAFRAQRGCRSNQVYSVKLDRDPIVRDLVSAMELLEQDHLPLLWVLLSDMGLLKEDFASEPEGPEDYVEGEYLYLGREAPDWWLDPVSPNNLLDESAVGLIARFNPVLPIPGRCSEAALWQNLRAVLKRAINGKSPVSCLQEIASVSMDDSLWLEDADVLLGLARRLLFAALVRNPQTPAPLIQEIVGRSDARILQAAALNPKASSTISAMNALSIPSLPVTAYRNLRIRVCDRLSFSVSACAITERRFYSLFLPLINDSCSGTSPLSINDLDGVTRLYSDNGSGTASYAPELGRIRAVNDEVVRDFFELDLDWTEFFGGDFVVDAEIEVVS